MVAAALAVVTATPVAPPVVALAVVAALVAARAAPVVATALAAVAARAAPADQATRADVIWAAPQALNFYMKFEALARIQ